MLGISQIMIDESSILTEKVLGRVRRLLRAWGWGVPPAQEEPGVAGEAATGELRSKDSQRKECRRTHSRPKGQHVKKCSVRRIR